MHFSERPVVSRRSWLLAVALLPVALAAQERVALRPLPSPNQTIKIALTSSQSFGMAMENLPAPMQIDGSTTFRATQTVGSPDAEGRLRVTIRYDSVTMVMTLNGNSIGVEAAAKKLQDSTITALLDREGKVIALRLPASLDSLDATVRQMITALAGGLPSVTLAVGDTVSTTLSVPLPMQIPGMPMGQPITMETRNRFKLTAIEREGGDRVAVLSQTTDASLVHTMDIPTPVGNVSAQIDLKMNGPGTLRWNVDRGFIQLSSTDLTMDMTMVLSGPQTVTMKMQGTVRTVVTGSR